MNGLRRRLMKRRVSVIVRNDGGMVWIDVKGRVKKEDREAIKSIAFELMDDLKGR